MPDFCGTCKAPVVWALTPTGAKAPIDVEPVENGNVLLLSPQALGGAHLAVTLSKDTLEVGRSSGQLRVNHWSTCPDKAEWRERTDAKRKGISADA